MDMPLIGARLSAKGDGEMQKWLVSAGLAAMLISPVAAQTSPSTTSTATDLAATPFSFDLNALPHAEALPPPLDPNARPRIVLTEPMTPPPPAGELAREGGYSRSPSVAAATPPPSSPETNGRRCERTASGGTRCTTVLIQSSNGDGERVAADLDAATARLEASVNRELDRLSNPPPR